MTRADNSKKRNLSYNIRHRIYGSEMKAYDGDMIEYNSKQMPVGFFETKFGCGNFIDFNNDEFTCHYNLCLLSDIPLFSVSYYIFDKNGKQIDSDSELSQPFHVQYYVCGVNKRSLSYIPQPVEMTEVDYVKFLYKLRGLSKSDEFYKCLGLSNTLKQVTLPKICLRVS